MTRLSIDLSIIIGGPQGGGVESAGQIAVKVLTLKGYNVIGTREYHSNIMGAHSYFHIRASDSAPRALRLPVDSLIAIDAESILTHVNDVAKGSIVIYDVDSINHDVSTLAPMEHSLKKRIEKIFSERGTRPTVGEAIKLLEERGARTLGLPLKELLRKVSEETGSPLASIARAVNIMGLSVALHALGVELPYIVKAIEAQFGKRPKILAPNIAAARVAVEYAREKYGTRNPLPDGPHKGRVRMIVTGNEVVAMAKIVGGLTFESFYPITPSSDEAHYIEENMYLDVGESFRDAGLEKLSIVMLQAEDEIAAIGMALGAALAGARASTTTSGPGFSLMNEFISMAVEAEIPIVISLWMRAGPSTGIATRTGQQDLLHAIFSGHGDTPKIVIASGDHIEAFYDTIKAMNWAEKFQTPVIHLLDKYLASTLVTLDEWDIDPSLVEIDRGKRVYEPIKEYRRYEITEDGVSPMAPLGFNTMIINSLEHDEYGFVSEDPIDREAMILKRTRKLETISKSIPETEKALLHGDPDAKITIVSFGSTKQAILSAMEELDREGIKVNFLQLRVLSPFPKDLASKVLSKAEKIVSVEANATGQLSFLIKAHTGYSVGHLIQKLNARPFYDIDVVYGVKNVIESGVEKVVIGTGS